MQLHVLQELLESLQIEDTSQSDSDSDSSKEDGDVDTEHVIKVSVQALAGTTSRRSMRLQGQVGKFTVLILIDSGSSSNFINKHLADKTPIPDNRITYVQG